MSISRCGALRLSLTFLAALMLAGGVSAQTVTGTISGTVVDPQGQVIPGATVTVINEATADTRSAVRWRSIPCPMLCESASWSRWSRPGC